MSLLDPSLPLPLLPQIAVIETSTSDSKLSLNVPLTHRKIWWTSSESSFLLRTSTAFEDLRQQSINKFLCQPFFDVLLIDFITSASVRF